MRRYGGVLEHPASSNAWPSHGLPRPVGPAWDAALDGGWVCEVWQSAYGHPARKRTWLYAFGGVPSALRWERHPGTHQIGKFDIIKPTLSGRLASATPPLFRDALIDIAAKMRLVRHQGSHKTADPNCPDCDDTGRTCGPEDVLLPCQSCDRGAEEAAKDAAEYRALLEKERSMEQVPEEEWDGNYR